jgi:hypothetical protein
MTIRTTHQVKVHTVQAWRCIALAFCVPETEKLYALADGLRVKPMRFTLESLDLFQASPMKI